MPGLIKKIVSLSERKVSVTDSFVQPEASGSPGASLQRLIGIVNVALPDKTPEEYLYHLTRFFSERGFKIMLDAAPGTVIVQRSVEDIVEIVRQFKVTGVEGVVVLGPYPEGLMARLQNLSIPFVSIKTNEMGSDSYREFDFSTDVYGGGRLAGRHFLSHGHRKAIFFCSHLKTNMYKFEGLKKSWLEAGLPLEHCVEIEGMSLKDEAIIQQFCTLVHKHGFTACLASNDFIAARLMQHLRVAGIKVPDDLALVGFDGNHFVPLLAPSLTSVIQDYHETAMKAGYLLLQRMDDFAATDFQIIQEEHAVMPKLFIGASCGCDVAPDPLMKWTTEDRDLTAFYADKLITHC